MLGLLVSVADPPFLFIQPFAIIHDPAHGRLAVRCDFHKVQTRFLGLAQGLLFGNDADLIVCFIDEPNLSGSYLPIDTQTFFHW